MQDMIHVTVLLFGPAADIVGDHQLQYGLAPPATLASLTDLLAIKYPRLREAFPSLRYAVNEEYADPETPLATGDEIAIIPPVAGGDTDPVSLTTQPLDVAALADKVRHHSCGAVVTFLGVVRADGTPDNPLIALQYSAYESMALRHLRRLRSRAIEQFDIQNVAIAHRTGRMGVGEASIAIAVSAPHRSAACDACRWLIDTIKHDVPIWKQEIWTRGEPTWVNAPGHE